ncbi:MAG: dicarboxylate/amino acid:cation symporter [Myxococcales bacterium]|nr:dicarboxylate/amino acid:cation symporter [Myxococcales bacterium]MCB9522373.1 dicarboxylate/amino acid:cation symporter [Myxococcales bacterium]
MQIYTKILLGMAVGTVVGLTLGPNSSLLEADVYSLRDGGAAEVRLDPAQPATALPLPKGMALKVDILEPPDPGPLQANQPAEAWAKVNLVLNERMLLANKGRVAELVEKARPGTVVAAWLQIRYLPLEGGGHQATPVPISGLGDQVIAFVHPIGEVFMRGIKMVIVPLVFASLLVGIASLGDIRKLGRLGGRTLALYMITTAVAVTIGLLVAHIIQPGEFIDAADKARLTAQFAGDVGDKAAKAAAAPSTIENLLNIIPENPLQALTNGDMLQIIFFAVVFGIALTMLGEGEGKIVVTFFDKVQHAMIMVIHMVMAVAPYGVAALVAEVVGQSGASVLGALLVYGLTVVVGLFLHATLVYGGLVRVLAKVPLMGFLKAIRPAQLIAFSTSSSSAALPVSMECAEDNLGVSNSVSSFVLPLGSTVNMDGTALYQGVAALFIAQVFDIQLTLGDQLSIVGAATMASVGAAGVPGAGMVTLAMVLTASGIPQVGLALILGMDRLLDMFRTAVNVTGDLSVTTVMAVAEGETIDPLSSAEDAKDPNRGFEGRLDREPEPIEPDQG